MAMTIKQAEKKGYVPTKLEITVYMNPKNGNLLFPCDAEKDRLYDRYIYLTDPDPGSDQVFALRCKDHRRKWQRNQIAATAEALVLQGAKMYLQGKWEKLTKTKIDKLRKEYEWFPIIEVEF
jgi:hypothetical protein